MIDLYYAPTPNGQKISIMLEETELPYRTILVNILDGDQFKPEFVAINPNSKIPVIVDQDGPGGRPYSVFESGAILLYLAEKTGMFMPQETAARYDVVQWLMFQMANIGPMFGQAGHFINYAPEPIPYAIQRYRRETARLYKVLDDQLTRYEYIAGDSYTIADMAVFPWITLHKGHKQDLEQVPQVKRWYEQLKQRPALRRGYGLLRRALNPEMTAEQKQTLLGIEKKEE